MKKIIILLWVGMLASFLPGECAAAVKLACLGDSITAGMLVKKEDCWVSRIAKELDKKAEVGNFGVSARCLLFRGDHPITREKAYQDALVFKPDVLLIGMAPMTARARTGATRRILSATTRRSSRSSGNRTPN